MYSFLIGCILGSFAQCLIDRYPHFCSTLLSQCPYCGHRLYPKDLIPIFSFLTLRGKCRYCHHPLKKDLFLSELGFGVLYLLLDILSPHVLLLKIAIPLFYVLARIDQTFQEVPEFGWIGICLFPLILKSSFHWLEALLCLIGCLAFVFTKKLGFGDAKLLFAWALFQGSSILWCIFFASFFCCLVEIPRHPFKKRIPFVPYLCASFLFVFFLEHYTAFSSFVGR